MISKYTLENSDVQFQCYTKLCGEFLQKNGIPPFQSSLSTNAHFPSVQQIQPQEGAYDIHWRLKSPKEHQTEIINAKKIKSLNKKIFTDQLTVDEEHPLDWEIPFKVSHNKLKAAKMKPWNGDGDLLMKFRNSFAAATIGSFDAL